jgi:hypothetical protein
MIELLRFVSLTIFSKKPNFFWFKIFGIELLHFVSPSKYFYSNQIFCFRIFGLELLRFVSLSNFTPNRTFFVSNKLLRFVPLSKIFGTNLSIFWNSVSVYISKNMNM